jgi:hypothetical protein
MAKSGKNTRNPAAAARPTPRETGSRNESGLSMAAE